MEKENQAISVITLARGSYQLMVTTPNGTAFIKPFIKMD